MQNIHSSQFAAPHCTYTNYTKAISTYSCCITNIRNKGQTLCSNRSFLVAFNNGTVGHSFVAKKP